MLEHRLREFFAAESAVATVAAPVAFVPCPVLAGFSQSHQSLVAEIYRIASEMTAAQLAAPRPTRSFPPAFSLN